MNSNFSTDFAIYIKNIFLHFLRMLIFIANTILFFVTIVLVLFVVIFVLMIMFFQFLDQEIKDNTRRY